MTSAYAVQVGFRGRNDDVGLNSTTWTYVQNANWTQLVDQNFRVRFEFEEQNTKNFTFQGRIEYSLNGGAWVQVTTISSVIRTFTSTQFADDDPTTNLLTMSARTFVAGYGDETGITPTIIISNSHTEVEYCLQIVGADVVNGDLIQIRSQAVSSYTVTPTVTVSKPVDNNCIAKDLVSAPPTIDLPDLVQNALAAIDLVSGIPTIDAPVLVLTQALIANDLTSSVPTIDQPVLVQNALVSTDITGGIPTIDKPTLNQSTAITFPIAFGEQNPTGQSAVPWSTWSNGAAQVPTLVGGEWGQLALLSGEEGRSAVYDLDVLKNWDLELSANQYGSGVDSHELQIRGSTTTFLQDDVTPTWETYSGIVSRNWRYVQVRAIPVQDMVSKDLLFGVPTIDKPTLNQGVTYYVDSVSGLDTNDGLSEALAWQTLAKVNAFGLAAGSNVLFKRGQTFTGILRPTASGSAGNYIRFGAYGTGARPIIDHGANFCSCYPETPFLRFEELDFTGSNASNFSTVMAVMHDLYFYDCIFRDSLYMGLQAWTNDGEQIYNIIVDTCQAYNNVASGITISSNVGALGPHDCEVKNCIAHNNGTTAWADHGIYCRYGVSIHDNISYSNPVGGGIKVNNETIVTSLFPTVYNNICYDNFIGLYAVHTNAVIYNNLCYSNTIQVNLDSDSDNMKFYFNTLVNALNNVDAMFFRIETENMFGSIFKNNIFIQDRAVSAKNVYRGFGNAALQNFAANNTFDYNIYYTDGNSSTNIMLDSDQSMNWTQWKALTGSPDVNSTFLTALPGFVARYTNLHPADAGNLKGLGVAIAGYTIDLDGITRADPPTPGCYESDGVP